MPGSRLLYPERIPLVNGGMAEAERGIVFVPSNRSDPNTRTLAIEIYRFRAAQGVPTDRPPIFLLHGGPGWPGLSGQLARQGFYESNIQPLTAIADLVVVGQRGIGSSTPNTVCDGLGDMPNDRHIPMEEFGQSLRATLKRCKEYWEAKGLDLAEHNMEAYPDYTIFTAR